MHTVIPIIGGLSARSVNYVVQPVSKLACRASGSGPCSFESLWSKQGFECTSFKPGKTVRIYYRIDHEFTTFDYDFTTAANWICLILSHGNHWRY